MEELDRPTAADFGAQARLTMLVETGEAFRFDGAVILRMLERAALRDHLVVVTRWYGGKPLGGDRFRHVQDAVRIYLAGL